MLASCNIGNPHSVTLQFQKPRCFANSNLSPVLETFLSGTLLTVCGQQECTGQLRTVSNRPLRGDRCYLTRATSFT